MITMRMYYFWQNLIIFLVINNFRNENNMAYIAYTRKIYLTSD